MSAALILTGAPGSGKSSVLDALSTLLEIDETAFGAIESEQLARGWPWLAASDWLPQLAAVIDLQRAAGRDLFLVTATTETQLELRGVIDALAIDHVIVICLQAPAEVVAGRIADREPDAWPGKDPLIAHARQLARSMPAIAGVDVVLDTDGRSPVQVAAQVRELPRKHDLLPSPHG
jgi:chloramphenicol 3-O-phosphotransferase